MATGRRTENRFALTSHAHCDLPKMDQLKNSHQSCGRWHRNGTQRLLCVNAWPMECTIRGVALLEQVCHWGMAYSFEISYAQAPPSVAQSLLLLQIKMQNSQLPLQLRVCLDTIMLPAMTTMD